MGLLDLMVTERSGVDESPNEVRAKRAERLEPYDGWLRLFLKRIGNSNSLFHTSKVSIPAYSKGYFSLHRKNHQRESPI